MAVDPALLAKAEQIRDANTVGENTAVRVGGLFVDIVNALGNVDDTFTTLSTYLTQYMAKIGADGILDWQDSPIVLLASMGAALDGDAGAVVNAGDLYFYDHGGYQIFVSDGHGGGTGYPATQNVLYVNTYTGKMYEWNGADMVEIVSGGGADVVNDLTTGGATKALSAEMGKDLNIYIYRLANILSDAFEHLAWLDNSAPSIVQDLDDLISEVDATPGIIVSKNSMTFNAQTGESVTQTFTVKGKSLTNNINIAVSGSKFSVDKSVIAKDAGETTVTVTFRSTTAGSYSGSIVVSSTGATSKTITLSGTAAAVVTPQIIVTPNTLNFSTVEGTPVTQTFTVLGDHLTNDIQVSVIAGVRFSVDTNTISKDAGETTVTVTFDAAASGNFLGTVQLTSTGATSQNVSLSATATALPVLAATFDGLVDIYTCDTLDFVKTHLAVDYGGVTVPSTDYTLTGSLTEGTSTLTVTYNGNTTTVTLTVLAGVASFYDFLNKYNANYQFAGSEPYATANTKRSAYWKMDKRMAGGKTYTFIANVNYNTAQFGFLFYNQQIADAYESHSGVGSLNNKWWDSTWQDQGVNAQFTPEASANGYPIVGCRPTSRVDTSDSVIPDDYLIERVVLIEVVSP